MSAIATGCATCRDLPQPIPYVSIRIQYSGTPGSMIAEVSSVELQGDLVMDSKVENEANGWAGSGANPWHLDKQTESFLFLTDMGEQPARIGFKVWANGKVYYLGKLQLIPHETRMIDLRKLRDAQRPDLEKHTIPAGASDGSVLWTRLDNVPVMGRLAVITRQGGVASSYDCTQCQCPPYYTGTTIVNQCPVMVNGTDQQSAEQWFELYCSGSWYFQDITIDAFWSSSNSNIFTINTSSPIGLLNALRVGTANAVAYGPTSECTSWLLTGYSCTCQGWTGPGGVGPCSVENPTITVTRQALTSTLAAGSPSSGAVNPAFTYAAAVYGGGGGNIASYTTSNPNANPNTASINAPSNSGPPAQGAYGILTATYNTSGGSPFLQFYVPTFGLSCYNTQLETDYISGGTCTSITINGVVYSGTDTNPSGLPAGTYCDAFLGMVELNGSGQTQNGTDIQWVSGNKPNWTFQVITQFLGADLTPVVANQTLARDRSIIPKATPSITVQSPGGNYAANDIGGKISLYRLDIYMGIGNSVCSGFSNNIVVGACSPSTPTALCPSSAIQ